MRADFVSRPRVLPAIIVCWLFCCAPPLIAQQPAADAPPTSPPATVISYPSSNGGGSTPPAAQQQQRPRRVTPPPYYDYPFGSATTKDRTLTIDEAIDLALAQASAYQLSQLDERVAAEDVKQARSAFFPQFSAPFTYAGTTPSQVHVPGEPITFSLLSNNSINQMIMLFNASGEIDMSGRLRASLRRNRHLLEATRAGTLIARRSLVISTVDAYYGLVLARQKRRLADETLSLAEGFKKVAEDLIKRGEGDPIDVLRARTEALKRRDEIEQARAGEAAAMDLLRVVTGVDFTTHISVTRITEEVPTASDFNHYTEELFKSRPELAQLDALKRAAMEDARVAHSERLPQFSYSLNGGFDTPDLNQLRRFSGGSAFLTMNVPIFNFGASKSRETQARLRAQALDVQRENTLRQLRQEFYMARAGALSALARIKDTEAQAAAAQQNVTMVLTRYRMKKAGILEVVDAQSAYAEARLAYYQALTDYRTSRVRLETTPGQ